MPGGWELSAGERIPVFTTPTHVYTGSIAKYLGSYWISLRPYITPGDGGVSQSYYLSIRRYYEDETHFINITGGGGVGASPSQEIIRDNPNSVSAISSYGIRINGQIPYYNESFYFRWLVSYGNEVYQTSGSRDYWTAGAGISVPF